VEVIRGFIERRVRSALTIAGIVLGMLALTMTGAVAEHFDAQLRGGVTYFSSNIQVADDAGTYAGVISLTKADAIGKVPGVAAAFPSISLLARPGSLNSSPLGLPDTISYSDPQEQKYSKLKTALASGRQLDPKKQGEVVLGADLASEFRLKVGDSIELPVRPKNPNPEFVNHAFKVAGILKKTNTIPDAIAGVGLLDAQMLLQESLPASFRDRVDPSSLASGVIVYGKPGVDLDQLADKINTTVPGVSATRPSVYVQSFDVGGRVTTVAIGIALLTLVFGAIFVVNTMLVSGIEREREIALKMAFGAHPWHIVAEHVLEATAMGVVGGVLGFAIAFGLAELLDLAGRSIGMDVFLVTVRQAEITLALGVALGAVAGVWPALLAARVDPDAALRTL
jgi:putative ABC transport system permease protein